MEKTTGRLLPFLFLSLSVLCVCCGSRNKNGDFPENFQKENDKNQVAFVMKNATPDSVARFISLAALGQVPGAEIDTLANAVAYAYDHYKDEDLVIFSEAYDNFRQTLPLADSFRLTMMSGEVDSIGVGYQLGLEYVNKIRTQGLKVPQIEKEIADFRKYCGTDTTTYRRFVTGFKTVLELDRGKDLKDDVYKKFVNLN